MYCAYCGENIPADSKFCGACGRTVAPKPAASTSIPTTPSLPTRRAHAAQGSSEPTILSTPAESVESPTPIRGRPVAERSPRRISNERSNKLLAMYGVLTTIVVVILVVYFATRGANGASSASATPTPISLISMLTPITPSSQPSQISPTTNPVLGIGTAVPDEGNAHVAQNTDITYKTYPPSSGTHYPDTAPNGFSEVEIPEGNFVHSMEHGAIVLYYRPDISNDVKQQLRDLFKKLPADQYGFVKLVVVPYTKGMTTPLAIAAWDRLLLMKEYNFEEIRTFYQSWVDKGPENVP